MAFIKYIEKEHIPEADRIKSEANILRIHSVHSKVMKKHLDLYVELMMNKAPLSRVQKEAIATVVSRVNSCHY